MNPYASYLGTHDPIAVIGETAPRLKQLVEKLGAQGVERSPAPGKWNTRQILAHLADCEVVFAFRLRQTLAEPKHVMQPFDQDVWAGPYAAYDVASAMNTFASVREWNLRLIKSLPAEAFAKTCNHPERGEMTFRTIVETMGGHDLNHLGQIETIAAE
jgi:hypothetical protein